MKRILIVPILFLALASWAPCATQENRSPQGEASIAVTVVGAVVKPGVVQLTEWNIVAAIAVSGGWSERANIRKAVVVRQKPEGAVEKIVVDVMAILNAQAPNVALQAKDVVYLPEKLD